MSPRRTLSDFRYVVVEREKATKKAERTLAAMQAAEVALAAAIAAHEKALAVLDTAEHVFDAVEGHLVASCGGRRYDANADSA